eukprot:m.123986 g.123986  ORF g.123986 m.123986 type:complete len:89 (-) comp29030_c0_seq1:886-1152(-)
MTQRRKKKRTKEKNTKKEHKKNEASKYQPIFLKNQTEQRRTKENGYTKFYRLTSGVGVSSGFLSSSSWNLMTTSSAGSKKEIPVLSIR